MSLLLVLGLKLELELEFEFELELEVEPHAGILPYIFHSNVFLWDGLIDRHNPCYCFIVMVSVVALYILEGILMVAYDSDSYN